MIITFLELSQVGFIRVQRTQANLPADHVPSGQTSVLSSVQNLPLLVVITWLLLVVIARLVAVIAGLAVVAMVRIVRA